MILSLLMLCLAILGLGFLIFIHEWGHYLMAKKAGMRIEVFSIGFGKALFSWNRSGVKWQLGMIPFGGFVKIAGMEQKGSIDPREIVDGYFSKSPWQRILVAIMGPIFNILFALVAFAVIWMLGGRIMPFAERTSYLGWVATDSAAYQNGIRAGDYILSINHHPYHNYSEYLVETMTSSTPLLIEGKKVDYWNKTKTPFQLMFDAKKDMAGKQFFLPGSYLIYQREPVFSNSNWSSLSKSGIQPNDRLIAVDGKLVFSLMQLIDVLNESEVTLTISRSGETHIARVPRLKIADIQLNSLMREEIGDWMHASKIAGKIEDTYFIPYALLGDAVVEDSFTFLNERAEPTHTYSVERTPYITQLEKGDKILAVDAASINSSIELLLALQQRRVQIVVQRESIETLAKNPEHNFASGYDLKVVDDLIKSRITGQNARQEGSYYLLEPVALIRRSEAPYSSELKQKMQEEVNEQKKAIEAIQDLKQRSLAQKELERYQNRLVMGGIFTDLSTKYNPSPFSLFTESFHSTIKTLVSLFSGQVSPKNIVGPVVLVAAIKHSLYQGITNALYWLGFISLNLAVLNLLPIPVLDGGHVLFFLYEGITGRKIRAKTMEKLIIPFMILLALLLIYATYNDILRLLRGLF